MGIDYQVGDHFSGVLLETFRDTRRARTRIRPLEIFPDEMRVGGFPKITRDQQPLGSRFRALVKVCQREDGEIFLWATPRTIELEEDYSPIRQISAIPKKDQKCEYVENSDEIQENALDALRKAAYDVAVDAVDVSEATTITRKRDKTIRSYAIERSKGKCEACGDPAPFTTRNGEPYLEVHHMTPVSKGGADHPSNVSAICPNCHRRTEISMDGEEFNEILKQTVTEKEDSLGITETIRGTGLC
jgi:5-methylcytosine-specific restriction endonuclease McrA